MNKYSVLLSIPDYLTHNYGQDVYFSYQDARNVNEAIGKAQLEASNDYPLTNDSNDFYPLLVLEGHPNSLGFAR